ncbi:MAG: hypothetical protein Q8R15_03030 [Candidatus Micrarchaeota archaeon]|nr:hypothetical protein [Candidatus Micrarchaeota archaeon]
MIGNFDVSCFKPVSYELRLASVATLLESDKDVSDLRDEQLPFVLKSSEYVLGKSVESLKMPQNMLGLLVPTSFAIRIGLAINSGKIDPTFSGNVSFGIQNLTKRSITLKKDTRLVHLMISEFKGETIPLESKYFGGTL